MCVKNWLIIWKSIKHINYRDTHILTIVTAMLKKEPSEVEEALLKTLTLKQNE